MTHMPGVEVRGEFTKTRCRWSSFENLNSFFYCPKCRHATKLVPEHWTDRSPGKESLQWIWRNYWWEPSAEEGDGSQIHRPTTF